MSAEQLARTALARITDLGRRMVKKAGDTMTGRLDVDSANEAIRLLGDSATARPYLSFYNQDSGGTHERKGYVGFPEAASDASAVRLTSDQGDIILRCDTGSRTVTLESSTGELKDEDGRQYLRTGSNRTAAQLVQYGTASGTTDSNGDHTVTFAEAFTTTPDVVATVMGTNPNFVTVHSVSTTGFKIRFWNDAGTALASLSRSANWFAGSPKTDI